MWILDQFRNPILDSASQFPSLTLNLNASFWVVLGVRRNSHSGRSPAATCALGSRNLSHRVESLGRYKSSSFSRQRPSTQVICFPYFSSANIILMIGTTCFSQRTGQAFFTLGSKNILYSKQHLQSKKTKQNASGKNPPAYAVYVRDMGSIPGSGRSPGEEHGNPLQYSWLENPMDREAWWAAVHRFPKSWLWLSNKAQHSSSIHPPMGEIETQRS